MLKTYSVDYQPSKALIAYNRFVRYIKIGAFLHLIAFLGIILFYFGLQKIILAVNTSFDLIDYFYTYIMLLGFTLPFFSEFDAFGRYQNYKLIKDKLYNYGYDDRLLRPFINSKCQRDAILVASSDLNCRDKAKEHFYNMGYRWYHILPDVFVKNPLVIFNKEFWLGILFTKKYKSQYFLW